jgi:hypothetical protein
MLNGRVDDEDDAIHIDEMEMALIKLQKTSEVSRRLQWFDHFTDVGIVVQ